MLVNEMIKVSYNEGYEREIARILKAKRLEKRLSLEEVSEGICSVSHLSRMENNLVKLQEPYLKLLFSKLDINYEVLKETRKKNLFVEALKKYLLNQTKQYNEIIEEILSSKHFVNIEQEMILLFDTLIKNRIDESEVLLEHIEKTNNLLVEQEKALYLYLLVLYYYKTNQINMAYRHISLIEDIKSEDEVIYWMNYELALNILFKVGQYNKYMIMYNKFIKDAPSIYFSLFYKEHQYKMLYLESLDDYDTSIYKMQELYQEVDIENNAMIERYFYYLGLIMVNKGRYDSYIKIVDLKNLSSDIIKLLTICLMNVEPNELYLEKIETIINYGFNKYEENLKTLVEYTTLKFSSGSIVRMNSLLKNKLFNSLKNTYDFIMYKTILKEIVTFNSKYGKYKDACIFIKNILNNSGINLLEG